MHVSYNSWTGWSCGFSYSAGFMHVGVAFGGGYGGYYRPGYPPRYYRPPYYPPGGYRPPYRPPGYRPGVRPTPYTGRGVAQTRPGSNNNLYRQGTNRDRVAPQSKQRDASLAKADRVAKGPNNVYADKNGNVHRQTSQGWESRDQGQWKPSQPSAKPAPASPSAQPARPTTRPLPPNTTPKQATAKPGTPPRSSQAPANLGRDAQSRQHGASRSAGSHSMSRGGGGRGR
jgi:hypothetical protein